MVLSLILFYFQINKETSKPKLAPLNEGGVSELLNKVKTYCTSYVYILTVECACSTMLIFIQEIMRLQEENDKLKARLRTLESQVWKLVTQFLNTQQWVNAVHTLLSLIFSGNECTRWENQSRESSQRPAEGARWRAGTVWIVACKYLSMLLILL